jgi:hypothetical protein
VARSVKRRLPGDDVTKKNYAVWQEVLRARHALEYFLTLSQVRK